MRKRFLFHQRYPLSQTVCRPRVSRYGLYVIPWVKTTLFHTHVCEFKKRYSRKSSHDSVEKHQSYKTSVLRMRKRFLFHQRYPLRKTVCRPWVSRQGLFILPWAKTTLFHTRVWEFKNDIREGRPTILWKNTRATKRAFYV